MAAFDPDTAGGVPFNPDTAGGVAFNPDTAGGVPASGILANASAGAKEGVQGLAQTLLGGLAKPISEGVAEALPPSLQARLHRPAITDAQITQGIDANTPGTPPADVQANTNTQKIVRKAAAGATAGAVLGGLGAGGGLIGAAKMGTAGGAAGEVAREHAPAGYENAAELAGNLVGGGLEGVRQGFRPGATPTPEPPQVGARATMMNRILAKRLPADADPEGQASSVRVSNMIDEQMKTGAVADGEAMTPNRAASSVSTNLLGQVRSVVQTLKDEGKITKSEWQAYKTMENAAEVHTNSLAMGETSMFRAIDDWNVPEATKAFVQEKLRDLNTAAAPGFQTNNTGPGRLIGGMAGHLLYPVAGHYGPMLGRAAGGLVDGAIGAGVPKVSLAAMNAAKAMRASGVDPTAVTPMPMPGRFGPGQPDPATGLPSSPIPPNVPIRGPQAAPTGGANLPQLRPDTPESVASSRLAEDGPVPQAPQMTPGAKYAVQGGFARDHAHAVEVAQAAVEAGKMTPQEAAQVASGIAPLMPDAAARYRGFAIDQQKAALGIKPADDYPWQKKFAAQTYQSAVSDAMRRYPPDVQAAIQTVAHQHHISEKIAVGSQLAQTNPAIKAAFDAEPWLFKTGGKD